MRIRHQIVVLYLPLALLPVLLLAWLVHASSRSALAEGLDHLQRVDRLAARVEEQSGQLLVGLSEQFAEQQEQYLGQVARELDGQHAYLVRLLDTVRSMPMFALFVDDQAMRTSNIRQRLSLNLDAILGSYELAQIIATDLAGHEIMRVASNVVPPGGDPILDARPLPNHSSDESASTWFIASQRLPEQPNQTTVYWDTDHPTARPVVAVSGSLRYLAGSYSWRHGAEKGYLMINVTIERLLGDTIEHVDSRGAVLLATDADGRICLAADTALIGRPVAEAIAPMADALHSQRSCMDGALQLHLLTGTSTFDRQVARLSTLREDIAGEGKRLHHQIERASGLPEDFRFWLVVDIAAAACFAVMSVIWLRQRLGRPLAELGRAARALADGNLDATVPADRRDEIGEVARAFHEMRERINQQLQDLQTTNVDLRQANEQAQEAVRAKANFLANMSHELRTPINGVIGTADLLAETALDNEQQDLLYTMRVSGEATLALINDILDLSKIEAGQMALERTQVDVRELVEHVVGVLAETAQGKGVSIYGLVDDRIRAPVFTDPTRLRQILTNLVGNGVKFTAKGQVVLRADVVNMEDDSVDIRFAVSDTGIGIPDEAREALFAPFFQADSSTSRRFGGTGLGLAISQSLASMLGGRIAVDSEDGHGSTFYLDLRFDCLPPTAVTSNPDPCSVVCIGATGHLRTSIEQIYTVRGHQLRCCLAVDELQTLTRATKRVDQVLLVDPGDDRRIGALERITALQPEMPGGVVLITSVVKRPQIPVEEKQAFARVITEPLRISAIDGCLRTIATGGGASRRFALKRRRSEMLLHGTVLLVEDNRINQQVAVRMLEKLGLEVVVADNGREAIDAYRRVELDAILMDCQMPELDGYQTSRDIRRIEAMTTDGEHVPIIALTANAMEEDRERCLASGMDDYLSKPVRRDALREALLRWLNPDQSE